MQQFYKDGRSGAKDLDWHQVARYLPSKKWLGCPLSLYDFVRRVREEPADSEDLGSDSSNTLVGGHVRTPEQSDNEASVYDEVDDAEDEQVKTIEDQAKSPGPNPRKRNRKRKGTQEPHAPPVANTEDRSHQIIPIITLEQPSRSGSPHARAAPTIRINPSS